LHLHFVLALTFTFAFARWLGFDIYICICICTLAWLWHLHLHLHFGLALAFTLTFALWLGFDIHIYICTLAWLWHLHLHLHFGLALTFTCSFTFAFELWLAWFWHLHLHLHFGLALAFTFAFTPWLGFGIYTCIYACIYICIYTLTCLALAFTFAFALWLGFGIYICICICTLAWLWHLHLRFGLALAFTFTFAFTLWLGFDIYICICTLAWLWHLHLHLRLRLHLHFGLALAFTFVFAFAAYKLPLCSGRLFQQIYDGEKTVDARIRYPSYTRIKVGDILEFRWKDCVVYRRVVGVSVYSDFETMLKIQGVRACLPHLKERDYNGALKFYHSLTNYAQLAIEHRVVAFRLGTIQVPPFQPWNRLQIKKLEKMLKPETCGLWLTRFASGSFARVYKLKFVKKVQQQLPGNMQVTSMTLSHHHHQLHDPLTNDHRHHTYTHDDLHHPGRTAEKYCRAHAKINAEASRSKKGVCCDSIDCPAPASSPCSVRASYTSRVVDKQVGPHLPSIHPSTHPFITCAPVIDPNAHACSCTNTGGTMKHCVTTSQKSVYVTVVL